ncbi:BspA family leucine-rich repeat surface protein [Mycoplasma feriruminatoris]|nr:BspA family leucine-rich repeat surface protein [Mycoplasma feriruminatoris]
MIAIASFLFFILSIFNIYFLTINNNEVIFYNNSQEKKEEEYKVHKYKDYKTREEITDLGFYKKDGVITLMSIPWHVKKVPETLPKNVKSLYKAFANRYEHHKEVTGFEKWDTSQITDMSYAFYDNHTINVDLSSWKTDNVTNMQGMFKKAVKFNNGGKPLNWMTSNVTSMNSMFDEAKSFTQDLMSWDVKKVTDNKNFSRDSGISAEPNKKPKWNNMTEDNDPIVKKPAEKQPEVIIHPPVRAPKKTIPWVKIVTPPTPTTKSTPNLVNPKSIMTQNPTSKKLSTPAIVGIVVGTQVILTSLGFGIPYIIKRFKK